MRPIHLVTLDKNRPALILTRESVRPHLQRVTIAPITSRARGISSELRVGRRNGLDHDSVVNCDGLTTILRRDLGPQIGFLLDSQEPDLATAIQAAFDLTLD